MFPPLSPVPHSTHGVCVCVLCVCVCVCVRACVHVCVIHSTGHGGAGAVLQQTHSKQNSAMISRGSLVCISQCVSIYVRTYVDK